MCGVENVQPKFKMELFQKNAGGCALNMGFLVHLQNHKSKSS